MQTRINLPQLLHEAVCGFAQLSQSLHANFFHPFLGRHSQSHSFRWTNMTRHWREKSQLKINTSSNTLFTFPVSLFIPKYPVGAGARWLTHAFEIFTRILSSYIRQFNPLWLGGDTGVSHLLLQFAASKLSCFKYFGAFGWSLWLPLMRGQAEDCLPLYPIFSNIIINLLPLSIGIIFHSQSCQQIVLSLKLKHKVPYLAHVAEAGLLEWA